MTGTKLRMNGTVMQNQRRQRPHGRQNNNNNYNNNGGGSRRTNNNNSGSGGYSRNQTFDSNGPDVRVRGTAQQVYEKYLNSARDASAVGDNIRAENLLQHAEHYFRILASIQETWQSQGDQQQPGQQNQPQGHQAQHGQSQQGQSQNQSQGYQPPAGGYQQGGQQNSMQSENQPQIDDYPTPAKLMGEQPVMLNPSFGADNGEQAPAARSQRPQRAPRQPRARGGYVPSGQPVSEEQPALGDAPAEFSQNTFSQDDRAAS